MKRLNLLDRIAFLAEKRSQLFDAARDAARTDLSAVYREQAEKQLELRATAYGLAVKRYLGGRSE